MIVIDFTGFFIGDSYKIKEFALCYVYKITLRVHLFVIVPSVNSQITHRSLMKSNKNYQEFYHKCNIKLKKGRTSELKLNSILLKVFSDKRYIFVRTRQHVDLLEKYTNLKWDHLKTLGVNCEEESLETKCQTHDRSNSYCVEDNVRLMAYYMMSLRTKLNTHVFKNSCAVIDFSGYYDDNQIFKFKEISVYIVDTDGSMLGNTLLISKPEVPLETLSPKVQSNYLNYYNSYGIEWDEGDHNSVTINRALVFESVFGDRYEVGHLRNHGYIEKPITTDSDHHTHEIPEKNVCVKPIAGHMTFWVHRKKLFEDVAKK
ncbi:hypothetical protein KQX54_017912 [Cotesia glomerata]|uniref:Uncharacterized protein n=1 Tax=Cotesia glomerata TaxID=32391 RepID=A0AAV7I448_COTGL|nr:hypothetical protein KQX54_017912 [Cotesia glomerata]